MSTSESTITSFPDRPAPGSNRPPATIANVDHLLKHAGISVRYNEITKRDEILIPGLEGSSDNVDNVTLSHIVSLAASHHMPTGNVAGFVEAIANRDAFNPMRDWIRSKPWDGTDRLPMVYATVEAADDFPTYMKELLLTKWLRSVVAAAIMNSFRSRGVLTLQGPQGIGKSSWIKSLISDPTLADTMVKLGHHMDPSNKDSILGAITRAITELGELDSSFKKDLARLKGFLTDDTDRVRRPYDRREASYPRRTAFAATVNEHTFLTDPTGNTRFWTIPVVSLDFEHTVDMQQVFSQLATQIEAGETWWLTDDENRCLECLNEAHAVVTPVAERLADAIDYDRIGEPQFKALTATEVAEYLGFDASIGIARDTGAALRKLVGPPKRHRGVYKWRVPFTTAWVKLDRASGVHPEPDEVF